MNRLRKFLLTSVTLVAALTLFAAPVSADLTISSATQFSTLDGGINDADGLANGCFLYTGGNFTITAAGSILNNDPASPSGNSAGNICANVTAGDILLQGGVRAENTVGGGSGGNIQLTASGNITLQSTAVISSSKTAGAGDTGHGGDITLTATGADSDITIASGAVVKANANGVGGDITITAPQYITINGTVESVGSTTAGKGGVIWIDSGCTLTVGDNGKVSSKGQDKGADLVHLEGCDVNIFGLVESTGPGHDPGSENNTKARQCFDADGGNNSNATRSDKPWNSTACVEIWAGGDLTIDRSGTHNGRINADTALSGGTQGRGWIDLIARGDVTIIGDSSTSGQPYAVHANQDDLTNGHGGEIKIQSYTGNVTASGLAVQADANHGNAGGGDGGEINIDAFNNVNLTGAWLSAQGDSASGGGYGEGGLIDIRAYNGLITWENGEGNVQPTGSTISSDDRGEIELKDCLVGTSVNGTVFPDVGSATTPDFDSDCGGEPFLKSYVQLPPECDACTATPTPTPSATPSPTPTPSPSATPTPSPSPSPTPSETPSPSPTPTPEVQASPDPSPSPTPSPSEEPSPSPSPSPSEDPSPTPTPQTQASPDPTPSIPVEVDETPEGEETPGQQATPDPSDDPGVSASEDPGDPGTSNAGPGGGVAPTSFADTGALQSALPGLFLLAFGAFTLRRWRQLTR